MEKKKGLGNDILRVVMLVVGAIISTSILAFSVITIVDLNNGKFDNVPKYMFWMFVFLSLSSLANYFKERTKLNLIKCIVLLAVDIGLGITILFATYNPYLFSLCGGLYCLTIIVSRVFSIIKKHDLRNIILNSLIIAFALLMSLGMFLSTKKADINSIIVVECLFIAIVSFIEVFIAALSQLKLKVLFKIIVRTYSLEVIFGLITIMVAFSLVFMSYEENIPTFGDALWYSFAVVTTIGFGDFHAETILGRILTVILGVYGIIVVAILTSIIVNFYNETAGKEDVKQLKDIKNEENDKK